MAASATNVLAVELTLASRWILDPSRSTLTLRLRGLLCDATGRFTRIEGSVERRHALDLYACFAAETNSLTTGVAPRDQQLRSDRFFDAARYPLLRFESTSVRLTDGGEARLEGRLAIKGRTRPCTLEAVLEPWDDGLRLLATGNVDGVHFSVTAAPVPDTGAVRGSALTLSLDALLRRQPNPPLPAWRNSV